MYKSKFTGPEVDDAIERVLSGSGGGGEDSPIGYGDSDNSAVLRGSNNIAGLKGFYYKHIRFVDSKTANIYLTLDQIIPTVTTGGEVKDPDINPSKYWKDAKTYGEENADIISIINDNKYDRCARIYQFSGAMIQVKWLVEQPFSTIKQESELSPEDYSVYCLDKPEAGIVDIGKYAIATGTNNKATNVCAEVHGNANIAEGKFATVWGKSNIGGYNTTTFGEKNVNRADNSLVGGTNNTNEGNNSVMFGNKNANYGKRAFIVGNQNITNTENEAAFGQFNKSVQDTRFSIGIGTSDTKRKNAFEVKQNGDIYIEGVEGKIQDKLNQSIGSSSPMVSVTYEELVALRDNGELVAGMQYRITDHVTTTAQENTRSAGHQFDVIVTADNENTLNEVARACLHDGDTYFSQAGANLPAWQIWYCLDNDKTRFLWADEENGRGVIYRMIDEFGNDCPYDFKNILFIRDGKEYFTFSVTRDNQYFNDYSVDSKRCAFNVIHPWLITESYINKRKLNNNVFITDARGTYYDIPCMGNVLEENCYDNTFGTNTVWNHIGPFSDNNKFGNEVKHNTTLSRFSYNTLGNEIHHSTFGTQCKNNVIGNYIFHCHMGDGCISNLLASYSKCIEFGNGVYGVKLSAPGASESNYLRNYHVANGLNEGGNSTISPSISRGEDFNYIIAKNSSGVVKVFCIADLADIV